MYGALRIDPFAFPDPETDLPPGSRETDTAVIEVGGGSILIRTRTSPSELQGKLEVSMVYQEYTSWQQHQVYEGGALDWAGIVALIHASRTRQSYLPAYFTKSRPRVSTSLVMVSYEKM